MKWYWYLFPLFLYVTTLVSFHTNGILAYSTLLLAFGVIGLVEFFIKPNNQNNKDEHEAKENKMYRRIQIGFVVFQWMILLYFFYIIKHQHVSLATEIGRIICMGLLCGIFGINVAHELGHHVNKTDRFLAKCSLLTSLYMHFFIEHNKGHHKHVGTPNDSASAHFNESIYAFYLRSVIGSYRSAWCIANKEMKQNDGYYLNLKNEMIRFSLIEIGFLISIFLYGGLAVLIPFLLAALIGILLLESVNYIQHYGLSRKQQGSGSYERTQIYHSWDCHYPLGRILLFELSRHSDHHYLASRPYQILRFHEEAPLLPTGYPGSILLALLPMCWFRVMNKKIISFSTHQH